MATQHTEMGGRGLQPSRVKEGHPAATGGAWKLPLRSCPGFEWLRVLEEDGCLGGPAAGRAA